MQTLKIENKNISEAKCHLKFRNSSAICKKAAHTPQRPGAAAAFCFPSSSIQTSENDFSSKKSLKCFSK